jgi:hypothetical protein
MTNADLDEALSRALDFKSVIVYAASRDGGKSTAFWTDDIILKAGVERYCEADPEYRAVRLERWPKFASNAVYSYQLRQ